MSDVRAKTISEWVPGSPAMQRIGDRLHPWFMIGFQFALMGALLIPVVTHQRPSDGHSTIMLLMAGWSLLVVIHLRQQSRISDLEKKVADLESSRLA